MLQLANKYCFKANHTILFFIFSVAFGIWSQDNGTVKTDTNHINTSLSLFFLIDHSGSMFTQGLDPRDQWGYRFRVIRDFTDSIYSICPEARIGIAVFRQYLYFDPQDNARFTLCPAQDTGAYIPLLMLDSVYSPENELGYELLKGYMEADTVSDSSGYSYVDLVYVPTNTIINPLNTHINAAFDAARHALQSSPHMKKNQFIIFISDGEATYPPDGSMNDYVQGNNVATTFTVFLNQQGVVPNSIRQMTENIRNNGYSVSNYLSNYWVCENTNYDSLLSFFMLNILGSILTERIPTLIPHMSPTDLRKPTLYWQRPQVQGSHYTIQIATQSDFVSPLVSETVTDTSYTPQVALPCDTIYWRVKSNISSWSRSNSFLILDNRIPVLIPYENPTIVQQPTLTWHKPVGAISSYTIQIDTTPFFHAAITEVPVADTFYTCQTSLPPDTIYWRVKGDDSEYSPVSSFIIIDNRIPLLIPYEPAITLDTLPTLHWHSVPNASAYTIEISNTSNFSNTLVSAPVSDTLYKTVIALPLGHIYWRVQSNLLAKWSTIDNFQIQSSKVPFLIRFHGKDAQTSCPQFKWHPVATATSYKLLLADNPAGFGASIIPLTDTVYIPVVNLADGMWFWKVSCSINFEKYSPVDSVLVDSNTASIRINSSPVIPEISFLFTNYELKIVLQNYSRSEIFAHVYNTLGRKISHLKPINNRNSMVWNYSNINTKPVSNGVYIIRIVTRECIYVQRVLVNK